MSISGMLKNIKVKVRAQKVTICKNCDLSRVTHVLWPNFDVELETHGRNTI